MKRSFSMNAAAALACCIAGPVLADQLHVPSQYVTIQSAINAASDGDEVLVGPGTYSEQLRLLGKAITLRGIDGPSMTVLSGVVVPGSILLAIDGESTATVVEGFTFSNGQGGTLPNCFSLTARCGGAVYIGSQCAVTFRECRFVQNVGMAAGGAIYVHRGGVRVDTCEFQANGASHGGGIFVCGGGPAGVEITDSIFVSNTASHGGGINIDKDPPALTITRCTFASNTASHGAGARIRRAGGLTTIEDCLFSDNEAAFGAGLNLVVLNTESGEPSDAAVVHCTFTGNRSGFGGGIFSQSYADSGLPGPRPGLLIADSTFSGNSAGPCCNTGIYSSYCWQDGPGFGGGLDVRALDGAAQVVNCLFTGNTAVRGAALSASTCGEPNFGIDGGTVEIVNCTTDANSGTGVDLRVGYTGIARISNSIVRASTGAQVAKQLKNPIAGQATIAVEYSNVQGGHTGPGNIDASPQYADAPAGNFRLLPGSPCIDAGDSSAVPPDLTTDLAGAPRRTDDPATSDTGAGGAPAVDIGAYEFQPTTCLADINTDGFVDGIDYDTFNNHFEVGDPRADVNGDGFVDGIDYDTFNNAFEAGC